jgi:hypothetical protein
MADRVRRMVQGSEYPAVGIPVSTQHYAMLARNLLYIQTPVAIPCSPRYDIQPSLSERSGRASIDIHVSIISTGIASKLSRSVSSS